MNKCKKTKNSKECIKISKNGYLYLKISIIKRKSKKKSKISKINKQKSKKIRSRRKFGYSHDLGAKLYGVHYDDGMLLANNAFNWMGNPDARAEASA
jgi:hypothetical protein